jgi:hypothetical protein
MNKKKHATGSSAIDECNTSERSGIIMPKIHCPVGTKGNQK